MTNVQIGLFLGLFLGVMIGIVIGASLSFLAERLDARRRRLSASRLKECIVVQTADGTFRWMDHASFERASAAANDQLRRVCAKQN